MSRPIPVIWPARRVLGNVSVPEPETKHATTARHLQLGPTLGARDSADAAPSSSIALEGNILLLEIPEGERAYWILRKIGDTTRGSVHVGFALDRQAADKSTWTVQTSSGPYPFEMVAIKMQNNASIQRDATSGRDPAVELSALQIIANCVEEGSTTHVISTREVCSDNDHTYIIIPYFGEGQLIEYIVRLGPLSEAIACHFFRQIISGLSTMRRAGLCHGDLSLDTVLLRGNDCFIVGLGLSRQMPLSEGDSCTLLDPNESCGSNPIYLAPEIVRNGPYDGYAVDLWAAGIMLTVMLFGIQAPFPLASPQDRRYRQVVVKGNLRGMARKWDPLGRVSSDAADLIQSMLRENPADRLSLQEIKEHPWFLAEAASPDGLSFAAQSLLIS